MVTSPQGELTPMGIVPKYQRFRVVGIFHSGFYQYDSSFGFIRLTDAQALFGEPDLVSMISFKVDDLTTRPDRQEIEQAAGPGFLTTNWMEQNRELFRALKLEQIVTFIVIGLIVCVAALNILIALTMMVMEKTRDIAVLMSFGVRAGADAADLSDAGIADQRDRDGARAGAGLCCCLGRRPLPLHPAVGRGVFDRLSALCAAVDGWRDRGVVSLGVSLLATLYPSGSAARIAPAEALRYE